MKNRILTPSEHVDVIPQSGNKEENLRLAQAIAGTILDKKGRDVVIIDISAQSSFADYFVNATALNIRMLDTLRLEIENRCALLGVFAKGAEGQASSGWMLMDIGDVIVNLFLEEQRRTYQIEKIWSDGIFIEPEGLN